MKNIIKKSLKLISRKAKSAVAVLVAMMVVFSSLPLTAFAAEPSGNEYYNRIVDVNTMDNWKNYFDTENLTTKNAGGVWTDKSVFTDASSFGGKVSMLDDSKNFLTALSAISANKEVVGYSTVPTDTIMVLDLSGSMSSDSVAQLVKATNDAIKSLQQTNNNNRVGVVLYSGSSSDRTYSNAVTRLLPLDRYTSTASDGNFITYNNGTVSVNSRYVSGTKQNASFGSKSRGGATYIQAGLWEAYKMFSEVPDNEIIISDNNWQSGEYRMPIVVLMSDGAPTLGASKFADVENQTYGRNGTKGSDFGDGDDDQMTVGQGFLVQLTTSYIKNRIENKYKVHDKNGAGRSLFYTLGFNLTSITNDTSKSVATSVLNPDSTTVTDSLWNAYNDKSSATMQVSVVDRSKNNGYTNITINKNSYATSKSYVDEYFSASGNGLTDAFNTLVEEILLQSRYYPTHLEGGSPDFSGYVEFTDTLGEYMELKNMTGILLGDTLFDGHMMASKLADTSENGLGTPDNPTTLGDEFIRSVKTRLKISETADARSLVKAAWNAGQLCFETDKNGNVIKWSNYIGWYAKADGTFIKHWDESESSVAPADAVYKIKSYGFLGKTVGNIKNSDMMYMSVQVKTNIETGKQTVSWKIPASLVPMVTYLVTLKGTNVDKASDVSIKVENAESITPIRLIYETGLRSDLNEFNITGVAGNSILDTSRITDERHIALDGHTRLFWNNSYDITSASHDEHKVTLSEFTPSKENERFYYTFDSAVHKKTGTDTYALVGQNEILDENGEYYHRRYIFVDGDSKPQFFYEKMSAASIKAAKDNGWKADFKPYGQDTATGAWVVPKGTPARELNMYDEQKSTTDSIDTQSALMVFHPYLTEHNNTYYVDMNLGNNGLLAVTPATGIKISKTVDIFETGTSDLFKFRVSIEGGGSFDSWITDIDKVPSGNPTTATFKNGVYEFEMRRDQTFWLSGVPEGTKYTVEEISDNTDYKIKSVHVNNVSTGTTATGTVAKYYIDDVIFVNTAIGEGDLVITKKVVDKNGNEIDVSENVVFTAEVTLKDSSGAAVSGVFESSKGNITVSSNGKFTVNLKAGESLVVRNIPEETKYEVREINIPQGFEISAEKSSLAGVVDASANDEALIVNQYNPKSIDGSDISVVIKKEISGNRTDWLQGESYTFKLERLDHTRSMSSPLATATIDYNDADKSHLFSLSSENYAEAGTYYYRITEEKGNQGGITYDTAERRFSVVVADSDMDGDLEVIAVNNDVNTIISGKWTVTASFNNVYAPSGTATAEIDIKKVLSGHALNGYQFALYDKDPVLNNDATEIMKSGLTDAEGNVKIKLDYSANATGQTFTYYLAEINRGQTINNIKYSDEVYKVEVLIKDNLDGTIFAETVISGLAPGTTVPTFTNVYEPSDSDFVTISGRKEIIGDRLLNEGEFTFNITSDNAAAPMPSDLAVKNMANGSFSFPVIEFKDIHKNQTFVYKVTESKANVIGGFEYDSTVYTVTVTVEDVNQKIYATAVINNGQQNVNDIVFKNTYDPKDAEVVLSGTKLLTGKDMQNNEFAFKLEAVTSNAPMPSSNIANNNEKGEITFGKITFEKAGVYNYKLTEVKGADSRYDYDESVYEVKVTVTDNSEGLLSAKVELKKDNMLSSEIVFRNGFVPTPVSYDITANFGGLKKLEGRPLKDGEFSFALINAINGKQIGETVHNYASGNFAFPAVPLATTGVHHFKIAEVIGDEKGVSYDTATFHIRVNVVQDEYGVLSIESQRVYKSVVIKDQIGGTFSEVTTFEGLATGEKIEFINTYKADPTQIVISGTKKLEGRDLKGDEFSFELYNSDNKKLETVKNGVDGKFQFAAIEIKNAGKYVYNVREVDDSRENITYDDSVYTVTVIVTDKFDGTFEIEYEYSKGDEKAEDIDFINVYTEPVPTPTPTPELPQTGDSSNLLMWFATTFVSGYGIVAITVYNKKRRETQEN
ncbi:MAG: hypothetical protein E7560_02780 [Ruminococcaceae bacterium]|nr:hypothetical protein [Oscillospiraceae bacterium]